MSKDTSHTQHTNHLGHAHHAEEDELLTVSQVAKRLKVDDTTCRRWIKNGAMEAVALPHVGKRQAYRVKASTLHKILEPARVAQAV
jgi:excisionase family DNA binding protein